MSQDPYTGYSGQSQHSYPYGTQQNSYEAPLGSNATPAPYSYGQQEQSYDYAPPQAAPLPLEQAIKELPSQYLKVLTKPSVDTFAQEMGKANWNIVWVQLIGYALISAILSYITSLIMPNPFKIFDTTTNPIVALLIHWGLTLGLTPLVFVSFFIGNGLLYLIAKAFRGQGTFLAQGYTDLLLSIPLGIVSALVSRAPLLGGLMVFGISIYTIVLRIFSIMAVHRLSGGKATAVVLLPVVVSILLLVVLVAIMMMMILAMGVMR
jgi:hypothetical protein